MQWKWNEIYSSWLIKLTASDNLKTKHKETYKPPNIHDKKNINKAKLDG